MLHWQSVFELLQTQLILFGFLGKRSTSLLGFDVALVSVSSVLLLLCSECFFIKSCFRFIQIVDFDGFIDFAVILVDILNVSFDFFFDFVFLVLATPPDAEKNQTAAAQQRKQNGQQNV